MPGRCLDIASISRYLHRLAELEDVLHVEGHVGHCTRCREKLQRMKRYSETLFDDYDPAGRPHPGCPSLIALEHYLRDGLSERQMIRIQEHLFGCDSCARWARRRQPEYGSAPAQRCMATRAPDLDLRVARQGVRIDAGVALLDLAAAPTLMRRLDLHDELGQVPHVTRSRSLAFRCAGDGWVLQGRTDLFGLEGFRLSLRVRDTEQPLALWTRERVLERFAPTEAAAGRTRLLVPGHYFIGPSALQSPYLAVSVEADFLSAADMAACGYDACRYGAFQRALSDFAAAQALDPGEPAYEAMHRCTRDFAVSFGLEGADRDIRWEEDEPTTPDPPAANPPEVEAETADIDAIATLVRALRDDAERASRARPPRLCTSVLLSRRSFSPAYATLMQRLRALGALSRGSVETPMHLG